MSHLLRNSSTGGTVNPDFIRALPVFDSPENQYTLVALVNDAGAIIIRKQRKPPFDINQLGG